MTTNGRYRSREITGLQIKHLEYLEQALGLYWPVADPTNIMKFAEICLNLLSL